MTAAQTRTATALLRAWLEGSELVDTLAPKTAAYLAGLHAPMGSKAAAPASTAELTDAQLFAHYKRTAPLEDCRFFLAHAHLAGPLRAALSTLTDEAAAGLKRTDVYRRYVALQDQWRIDANARERSRRSRIAAYLAVRKDRQRRARIAAYLERRAARHRQAA